jgi:type IV pilus assembly protein PilE
MNRRLHGMRGTRGFTLIELMIAVAVLGILSGVAYPSYLSQVKKARRADARAALTAAAQSMERWYTERSTYAGATLGTSGIYPTTSTNGFYTLSIVSQTAAGFSLQAAPAGAQAGDACGSFTYDQTGTKGVSGGTLGFSACW